MPEVANPTTEKPEDEVVNLDTDMDLDSDDDDDDEEENGGDGKSKRPRFDPKNVWVFPVDGEVSLEDWMKKEGNVTATKAKEAAFDLVYTDNSKVNDDPKKLKTRVFRVTEGAKYDDDGNLTAGKPVAMILGTSKSHAAENYLDYLGVDIDLHYKKKRRGRAATKVEQSLLMLGKMLGQLLFGIDPMSGDACVDLEKVNDGALPDYVDQYKQFCPGGKFGHYIDIETNKWKEPTV